MLLVDREFKNSPREKALRQSMARIRTPWHLEQAASAESRSDWYAATFHLAWVVKGIAANPSQDKRYANANSALENAIDRWRDSIKDTPTNNLSDPDILFPPAVRDTLRAIQPQGRDEQ
ncbi:MAG TPA: hypothetical protein PKD64_07225 [Pirellulaceae bacterium]|nr:hypothetical protein [Pirellulaceae bacterium]HMO91976.1 hypothetical protein [Pirellulaceae bacterium]HMP68775.1 hypothetical protein [Pirellulaceae bacterium]